ncbi:hypothetical protein BJ741DRAFT_628735 [Chytriomyces cf. hyalinus JEL632]|nr:hypothetical protein BJ741DRAFT_628735 [Chytriomyces cf. hyalinus JEL632]
MRFSAVAHQLLKERPQVTLVAACRPSHGSRDESLPRSSSATGTLRQWARLWLGMGLMMGPSPRHSSETQAFSAAAVQAQSGLDFLAKRSNMNLKERRKQGLKKSDVSHHVSQSQRLELLWTEYRILVTGWSLQQRPSEDSRFALFANNPSLRQHVSTLMECASQMSPPLVGVDRIYSVMRDLESAQIPITRHECDTLVSAWHRAGLLSGARPKDVDSPTASSAAYCMRIAVARDGDDLFLSLLKFYSSRKSLVCLQILLLQWYHYPERRHLLINDTTLSDLVLILKHYLPLALALYQSELDARALQDYTRLSPSASKKTPLNVYIHLIYACSLTKGVAVFVDNSECRKIKKHYLANPLNFKWDIRFPTTPLQHTSLQDPSSSAPKTTSPTETVKTETNISSGIAAYKLFQSALKDYPLPSIPNAHSFDFTLHTRLYNNMVRAASKHCHTDLISILLSQMTEYDMHLDASSLSAVAGMQIRLLSSLPDNANANSADGSNLVSHDNPSSLQINVRRLLNGIYTSAHVDREVEVKVYDAIVRSLVGSRRFAVAMHVVDEFEGRFRAYGGTAAATRNPASYDAAGNIFTDNEAQIPQHRLNRSLDDLRKTLFDFVIMRAAESGKVKIVDSMVKKYQAAEFDIDADIIQVLHMHGVDVEEVVGFRGDQQGDNVMRERRADPNCFVLLPE